MSGHPATTLEIAALHALGRNADARWADWAADLLGEGRDGQALRELAGHSGPFHPPEAAALVRRVLDELGTPPFANKESAAAALATERARGVVAGSVLAEDALAELAQLHIELDHPPALDDFYLLHWARKDLRHDEVQHYWKDATRENIEEIVFERFRRWLKEHA